MAPRRSHAPAGSGARWWTACSVIGIALWIGATVWRATQLEPGDDPTPILRTFAIGGGVFFGLMFGAAALQVVVTRRRSTSALYHRLALEPVAPDALRHATRGTARLAFVYFGFGAVVTGLTLVGIGSGDDRNMRLMMTIAIALVVVWAVVALVVLRRLPTLGAGVFDPLGLRLVGVPTYDTSLLAGTTTMHGAMTYAGIRHGRAVSISQATGGSTTTVEGRFRFDGAPASPQAFAGATGEPPTAWRGVTVEVGPDEVSITRRGNGAGAAMLQDLALAEAIADRQQIRDAP
jgi:hypothetical protein